MGDAVNGVGCFVSIGTGRTTFDRENVGVMSKITPGGITSLSDAVKLCIRIATDCHKEHLEVEAKYAEYAPISSSTLVLDFRLIRYTQVQEIR